MAEEIDTLIRRINAYRRDNVDPPQEMWVDRETWCALDNLVGGIDGPLTFMGVLIEEAWAQEERDRA